MSKFHVKRPVKVAGQVHKPGAEPVEFDDKKVAGLVKSGALVPHEPKADKPWLERAVPEIQAQIPNWNDDELAHFFDEERKGKGRKKLLESFEAEIEKRTNPQ